MGIKVRNLSIPDVQVIEPEVFEDERGFFLESYNQGKFHELLAEVDFIQDNHSHSRKNTIRGLHYQLAHPQAKLVYVVTGRILDVAVDVRRGSPTFGQWVSEELSEDNHRQLFIPEGFAHGFCVLSDYADVMYKCSDFYHSDDAYGLLWSDQAIGIDWPITEPILSVKDRDNATLATVDPETLPVFVEE
ncbi:MAG: dTDP-4-dehydrorhamnose 3,5-epimerase [Sedimentisphaerales bacterium]|nr:dTDP-4-dehydrorhamnose 3,5-epimerase [Sedimentisphaerales bacterium]